MKIPFCKYNYFSPHHQGPAIFREYLNANSLYAREYKGYGGVK